MHSAFVCCATLLHEGHNHHGDEGVEEKVGDRDPVLKACPVVPNEHNEVLDATASSDAKPEDEEAAVVKLGPNQQENAAEDAEEGVKHTVFYDGPNADILALTLDVPRIDPLGVLDHIGDGDKDCDDELDQGNDVDGLLQRESTDRSEAGRSAHLSAGSETGRGVGGAQLCTWAPLTSQGSS